MSDGTRIERRIESDGPWPSFALPHGTVVNGYRIERVLGSGGFGVTYLAFDLLQQRFAIKEYYPRQFATRQHMTVQPTTREDAKLFEECRERFLREAQALVHLGRVADASDGIVRVKTYFEALGTCFLVMDYVEGNNLAGVFRDEPGGLSPPRVRSLLTQLLSSIRVVHRAGLVHRDIKPANVILREDDRLVLIDFGSTRQAMPTENTSFTQIYSGGYGPPEQMIGLRQGEFSDIYAIGAVCYRAIGGSVVDALARQNSLAAGRLDPQPSAVSIGAGRYPRSLLAAIDAALAVDPAQRPQTADAMLELLGPDQPVDMPSARTAGRMSPAAPRARRGAWVAAVGMAAVVLAGAAYLMLSRPVGAPRSAWSRPGGNRGRTRSIDGFPDHHACANSPHAAAAPAGSDRGAATSTRARAVTSGSGRAITVRSSGGWRQITALFCAAPDCRAGRRARVRFRVGRAGSGSISGGPA